MFPGAADPAITAQLLPGERVRWSGRPAGGIRFTGRDIFLVPFSLMWCGFAIFWTIGATRSGAPGFFDLWGAMFVLIGLYFVFGRFIVDAVIRRATRYALTDRRVLIVRGSPLRRSTALQIDQLPIIDLLGGDRRGTIRFGESPSTWGGSRNGFGTWVAALDPTPQFLAIEEPRRVHALIHQLADARAAELREAR
jgi:hypothetical protein